jgi:4-amino-4-deoxy-L-arabinose transferase-like glycosyltransferase
MNKKHIIFFLLIISTTFITLRCLTIPKIPLFWDESFYLSCAKNLVEDHQGNFFKICDPVKENGGYYVNPIFIWLTSLSFLFFKNLIFAGRLTSILVSLITLFLIFAILKIQKFKLAPYFSSILLLFLPFYSFYSQTATLEPSVNLFLTLSLFFALNLLHKANVKNFFLFSASQFISILTKITVLLSLPLFVLLPIFKMNKKKLKSHLKLLTLLLTSFLISIIAVRIYEILINYLLLKYSEVKFSNFIFNRISRISLAQVKTNLFVIRNQSFKYFTWPLLVLNFFACLYTIKRYLFRQKIYLLIAFCLFWEAVYIFLVVFLEVEQIHARRLYSIVIPFVLSTSIFLEKIYFFLKTRFFFSLVFFATLVPSIIFSSHLITDPQKADFPHDDFNQFFLDWTSSLGDYQVTQVLNQQAEKSYIVVFFKPTHLDYLAIKYNPHLNKEKITLIELPELINPSEKTPTSFTRYPGTKKYLVKNCHHPKIFNTWPLTKVFSFTKSYAREITLYQINLP